MAGNDVAQELLLLRQQNLLLTQELSRLTQPKEEEKEENFIDKPLLEPEKAFVRPADYPGGELTQFFTADPVGASGHPYLLDISSDPVYVHALTQGRSFQSGTLRQITSANAFSELGTLAATRLSAGVQAALKTYKDFVPTVAEAQLPITRPSDDATREERELYDYNFRPLHLDLSFLRFRLS